MAVSQYIGARYVPKFYENSSSTAEWTANTQYEPLTIVTRNGNSYTSKKSVPASVGAPEDNAAYWASTGIYNSQVEEYREETAAVADALDDLEDVVYSQLRHVVVIADSYGTYNGAGAGFEISYNLNDRLLTYLGWSNSYVHYSAQNGAGFCNGAYLSQLNALVVDDDVKPLVRDIYIVGGWNDENGRTGVDAATFASAAAAFKTAAATKFPNARLHVCFAAWTFDSNRTNQDIRTTKSWYFGLSKTGWVIEENYQWILHNSTWMIGGNVHPNQDGVNALADALAQIILKGQCHAQFSTVSTTRSNEIGTMPSNASIRIEQTMNDGLVYFSMRSVRGCYTLTTPQNIVCDGNATAIDLFTITGNFILKGYATNIITNVVINVFDGTDTYAVPAALYIANQVVKVCFGYLPAGSTYKTIASATKISVPDLGFTCKAW